MLIGGSRFEIEGNCECPLRRCKYIVGRMTERGWEVDSDADGSEVVFEETANLALRN